MKQDTKEQQNVTEAEQNVNDTSKIQIKPNVYAGRYINLANAHLNSYNYKRELDSHTMKNTEWGAVAYLSHSAYGIQDSIRLNNNVDYVTGYQAHNEPTCGYTGANEECNRYCNDNTCNTAYPNSDLASTTGNITGIFDMSGGSWEYVMAVMQNQTGTLFSGYNEQYFSGFSGPLTTSSTIINGLNFPEEQYYDIYNYNMQESHYNDRILGDASGEIGPFYGTTAGSQYSMSSWYNDVAEFPASFPWGRRSGGHKFGTQAGIFNTYHGGGHENVDSSFRIILTPTK